MITITVKLPANASPDAVDAVRVSVGSEERGGSQEVYLEGVTKTDKNVILTFTWP